MEHGPPSCGAWAQKLQYLSLVASQHVGISVPWPWIGPAAADLQDGFLSTGPPVKALFAHCVVTEQQTEL